MRQLWLLGPARVEQGRNAPAEAPENDTPPLPRFRSRRTVGLLGYLVLRVLVDGTLRVHGRVAPHPERTRGQTA